MTRVNSQGTLRARKCLYCIAGLLSLSTNIGAWYIINPAVDTHFAQNAQIACDGEAGSPNASYTLYIQRLVSGSRPYMQVLYSGNDTSTNAANPTWSQNCAPEGGSWGYCGMIQVKVFTASDYALRNNVFIDP